MDQRAVGCWVFKSDDAPCNLHVIERVGWLVDGKQAEAEFLTPGVNNRLVTRLGQCFPERRYVTDSQGINQGDLLAGRNLDQAKLRKITVLGHEFRVKGDHLGLSKIVTEIP